MDLPSNLTDNFCIRNEFSRSYESIYKHYHLPERSNNDLIENDSSQSNDHPRYSFLHKNPTRERNESHQKTITATTVKKKGKPNKTKQPQTKKNKKGDDVTVIKIPVPKTAKSRKTNYSGATKNQIKMKSSKSSTKVRSPSNLPNYDTASTSASDLKYLPPSSSLQPHPSSELNPISDRTSQAEPQSVVRKPPNPFDLPWNLDEIRNFTRRAFKTSPTNIVHAKISPIRPGRVKLRCEQTDETNIDDYIAAQSRCIDGFEEYVDISRRQHGIIRDASKDPAIFEPGITIMGATLKKDANVIDKEDANAIKMIAGIEPRKKYALVHEQKGIFIIGGYNLFVDIPAQKEPDVDYLFRFNGQVTRIPAIKPCRIHFGIYTDGKAIYVAGGQTLQNTLLDDIQRLNLETLQWEYVATLANPVAACGMTIYQDKIYIVGGFDILNNHTIVLPDYTIYNIATEQFEHCEDLPRPRCRSLIFATDGSIYCVSGLVETRDLKMVRKLRISRDILKWNEKEPIWKKVSQTPELTRNHALAFNEPYLEVVVRSVYDRKDVTESHEEAYYHFPSNTWHPGRAPTTEPEPKTAPPPPLPKSPTPSQLHPKSVGKSSKERSHGSSTGRKKPKGQSSSKKKDKAIDKRKKSKSQKSK